MRNISIEEIVKLRNITGAGILNAKKALIDAKGNFEKAIMYLRIQGQKIAANRKYKISSEGVVIAKINKNASMGVIISLNCETDFVAKNENFLKFAHFLAELALQYNSKESLLNATFEGVKIKDKLIEQTAVIGEKIEINKFKKISAPLVGSYVHTGNKIAAIVAFSTRVENALKIGKEIAMQIVGMNPIAIDSSDIDKNIIQKELDVANSMIEQEGKSKDIIENIIKGKLNKFFRENTLLNQEFINNQKISVKEYLNSISQDLKIISFERVGLS